MANDAIYLKRNRSTSDIVGSACFGWRTYVEAFVRGIMSLEDKLYFVKVGIVRRCILKREIDTPWPLQQSNACADGSVVFESAVVGA